MGGLLAAPAGAEALEPKPAVTSVAIDTEGQELEPGVLPVGTLPLSYNGD
jgi:hypothetical protein